MFAVVMYMQPLHLFPEKEEEKPNQPRRKAVSLKKSISIDFQFIV